MPCVCVCVRACVPEWPSVCHSFLFALCSEEMYIALQLKSWSHYRSLLGHTILSAAWKIFTDSLFTASDHLCLGSGLCID